jgi:predicted  nucleic acid-binding Zn-ribbon protein
MTWECSECGALHTRARSPIRCEACGTAGIIFVPSELESELDLETGSLLGSWYLAGHERAHPAT